MYIVNGKIIRRRPSNRRVLASHFLWFVALFFGLMIPLRSGYAVEIEVRSLSAAQGQAKAMVSLYGKANKGSKLQVQVSGEGEPVTLISKAALAPVHLGIVIDGASVCRGLKVDTAVQKLLASLPRLIHKSSRLTVIAFAGHTLEVLAQAVPLSDVGRVRFQCDARAISGSPEKALGRFIVTDDDENFPKVAWLFSSGNLRLAPPALQSLKKSQVPLDVFLYNKPLAAVLTPVAQEQASALNPGQYHFEVVAPAELDAAVQYLNVTADLPRSLAAGRADMKFTAMNGEEAIVSTTEVVNVAASPTAGLFTLILQVTGVLIGVALLAYGIYRVTRRRRCATCGRALEAGRSQCAFPHERLEAALVGQWLQVNAGKRDKPAALKIDRDVIEIGTHRRSRIPLVKPKTLRRACLARIHRIPLANGKSVYRMEAVPARGYGSVIRNGQPVVSGRNLAHGDEILIGNAKLKFVLQQEVP